MNLGFGVGFFQNIVNLGVESHEHDPQSFSGARAMPVELFLCAMGKFVCSLITGLQGTK